MRRRKSGRAARWLVVPGMAAALLAAPRDARALDNGLALTPPMGWNSYNKFGGDVTEAQVKAIADAFVADGLKDAGFEYIVVDYCWMQRRDANGQMVPVASKFPSGMKALGDYIHSKGLKFGMYQSPTLVTCCGEPGSYMHEESDAAQFASWGVDYVKYDWCGVQSKENGKVTKEDVIARYTAMRDAIAATQRPMVYAMCEKGQGTKVQAATWSAPIGNMWRTGNDIAATWARVLTSFDIVRDLGQYAKPGAWNDPDMLEVGNGKLTDAENRAHLSLWAIVAAPLMMGNDPSNMSAPVKAVLTNSEVIAVDQDPLGKAGKRLSTSTTQAETWVRQLADGSVAAVLFNRGDNAANMKVTWTDLGINGESLVRDLWRKADVGKFATEYSASVPSHDVVMIRVYPPGVVPGMGAGGAGGVSNGGTASVSGAAGIGVGGAAGSGEALGGASNGGSVSVGGAVSTAGTAGGAGVPPTSSGVGGSGSNSAVSDAGDAGCACSMPGRSTSRVALAGWLVGMLLLSRRRR